MVGRKRIKLGVQVNTRSVDPNPYAGRIQNFNICMNLCDGYCECGPAVNHRVLAEEDNFAGR
jgi:hypothetical protein